MVNSILYFVMSLEVGKIEKSTTSYVEITKVFFNCRNFTFIARLWVYSSLHSTIFLSPDFVTGTFTSKAYINAGLRCWTLFQPDLIILIFI